MSFTVTYNNGQYIFTYASGVPLYFRSPYVHFEIQNLNNNMVYVGDGVNFAVVDSTQCTSPTAVSPQLWVASLIALQTGQSVSISGPISLAAGTNLIGDVGLEARTSNIGAASKQHLVSALGNNLTLIKNSPGRVMGWNITNFAITAKFVKFHNLATTPAAGANVFLTVSLPAGSTNNQNIPVGVGFSNGIGISTTSGLADTDTSTILAGELAAEIYYS